MNVDRAHEIKTYGETKEFNSALGLELSVLIPTYNRAETLRQTLTALQKQDIDPSLYEIIVIDDGSSDDTESVLQAAISEMDRRVAFAVLKKNGGPARARNVGLAFCRGRIILNLGDDIEPDLSLLQKHYRFHLENEDEGAALLGFVSFPAALQKNAFMKWLESDGQKYFFHYSALEPGQVTDPIFFYTCNVSLKASLLEKSGWFDESFPFASHEDLELGYRLADKGMELVYDPSAIGHHWHELTIEGIAKRVYLMGRSAVIFWQKTGKSGSVLRRTIRRLLAALCSCSPGIYIWNRLRAKKYVETVTYPGQWHVLLFLGFFIGLADGYNNHPNRW